MAEIVPMTAADQPALWRSSDAAAIEGQRRYLWWTRLHLLVLGVTGLIAAWSPGDREIKAIASGVIALLMFGALVMALYLKQAHLDEDWFHARAVAENAKRVAWLFMMAPAPADPKRAESEEESFLEELKRIQDRFPLLTKDLARQDVRGTEITSRMRAIRSGAVAERLEIYRTFRLQDQIDWYQQRTSQNVKAASRWSAFVLVLEALAVVAAVAHALSGYAYNPTGAVAAIVAGLVAWSKTRRFSGLATAYGVAHGDLTLLHERVRFVHDEAALQRFVAEVEAAISREHRLWVEKRSA